MHTLGYADDAALLDRDIDVATAHVNSIAQCSRADADADMEIAQCEY